MKVLGGLTLLLKGTTLAPHCMLGETASKQRDELGRASGNARESGTVQGRRGRASRFGTRAAFAPFCVAGSQNGLSSDLNRGYCTYFADLAAAADMRAWVMPALLT
ncbi:hypothetical protein AYO39_01065 [Actinobacteria bacterium SCGC AG-212-D09]|nr:hypothetical protein AYO39_01065 [Actinobacteria bacterium SCGC AG-212-D09]